MTRNITLHLGAHRTGTTGLQAYLYKNERKLRDNGCDLLYPPKSREVRFDFFNPNGKYGIFSDENIIGYMEDNIAKASLYPELTRNLGRLGDLADRVEHVYLSIRNIEDYWKSSISYCMQRSGLDMPNETHLNKIAESERGWFDIVEEIRASFPNEVIVHIREFTWKTDNPKQQLISICKWPLLKETSLDRKKHNPSFDRDTLIRTLSERGAYDSTRRLAAYDRFELFTQKQKQKMYDLYMSDIERLFRRTDVQMLSSTLPELQKVFKPHSEKPKPTGSKGSHNTTTPRVLCFLHIGKTGGTFLKSKISAKVAKDRNIIIAGHNMTLHKSLEAYGPQRQLAFFFRDPEERFISAFNSRLRQGRPTYDVIWTASEAVAFSYFSDPNVLAEALYSDDERLYSAARFAFNSIFHLSLSYQHYLGSPESIENEFQMGNIQICCETHKIDRHWATIVSRLGLKEISSKSGEKNSSSHGPAHQLSKIARGNLSRYWQKEFDIYKACQKIAKQLKFDDPS